MLELTNEWLTILQIIVGSILPIIVGLVTKQIANGTVKSVTLLALAALATVITEVITAGSVDFAQSLLSFAVIFFAAVASHFGFLKPANVTGSEGVVQTKVSGGLG